jgi:hypothetical protein
MSITYGAGPGAEVLSYAMNETLINQTDQTGNNTVVVSDDIVTAGNGNISTVYWTTYVDRLIIINLGGTEQKRRVISQTAGTTVTNSIVLTVHEDWDTNPVASTDTIHVFYTLADVDTAGGIGLAAKTGVWELTNALTVGNGTDPAGLQLIDNTAMEVDDRGTSIDFQIKNNGRWDVGYTQGGLPVNGGHITCYDGVAGELAIQWDSGAKGDINDAYFWAQLNPTTWVNNAANNITFRKCKIVKWMYDQQLFGSTLEDFIVVGQLHANDFVHVGASTSWDVGQIVSTRGLIAVSGATETITLSNLTFINNIDYIVLTDNKTYNVIDPSWGLTSHADINDTAVTSSPAVYQQTSVTATVQEADGTLLQNALVNVYEHTQLADLVLEATTDANGSATGVFNYLGMTWTSGTGSTTTYGGHALQAGKWLYKPFVSTQSAANRFSGVIVLNPDNNIVQTTQATAKSAGSTITWNDDTNPSELVEFSSGSGTLADGMIVTFTSGAVGTITTAMSGDSTAGEFHMSTRNATAIANGDTFTRTGGTAGTFSGTYVNDSKQAFSIWIDGQDLAMQTIYDYLAAIQNETTLTANGELIWEWCRSAQTQPLYATGSSFYTERSNSKGIIVVDGGAGKQDYYTDDAGVQWVPPVSISVTFAKMKDNSEVWVFEAGTFTLIPGGYIEDATTGTTDNRSFTWSANASDVVDYVILAHADGDETYEVVEVNGFTVPSSNTTIDISQDYDRNFA